jgi:hypothetical protein
VVREKLARLQALERPEGADGVTAKRFTDTLAGEYRQEVLPSLGALERAIPKSDNEAIKRARRQLTRAQRNKRSSRFAAQLGASQCVIASGFGGQSSPVPVGP